MFGLQRCCALIACWLVMGACGMSDHEVIYRKKVAACIPLLYPEVSGNKKEMDKLVGVKSIEWRREFVHAMEYDLVDKAKKYLEIDLFPLFESDITRAYVHKHIGMMEYLLEYMLRTYEGKNLAEKASTNFFSFLTLEQRYSGKKDQEFDLFFSTFEQYFWSMRFYKNIAAYDVEEQIACYHERILWGWCPGKFLSDDALSKQYYHDTVRKLFKTTSHKQLYILRAAQLFKHDEVLHQLHFTQDIATLHGLHNVSVHFE